jgi:hypothetical protein
MKDVPGIVKKLSEDLKLAHIAEYMAKADAQMAADRVERRGAQVLHKAYAEGVIGGKGTNAEVRKQQEAAHLGLSHDYGIGLEYQAALELQAAIATAERRGLETTISLTKAWWYTGASDAEEGPR